MAESVFVHVQCDKELREAFKNKAEESDRQISQLIRGFMRDYVNGETGAPVSIEEKSLPFQRKWDPSEEKAMKRALKQDTRSEAQVYLSPSDFRGLN